MRFAAASVLVVALFSGCATRYVVLSDVPPNPSFTVIPGSVSKGNMEFANTVTEALVSCGVRVVERPAMVSGYAESRGSGVGLGVAGGAASGGARAGGVGLVAGSGKEEVATQAIDVVDLYEQSSADYLVVAFSTNTWVKIVRRESKDILFGGSIAAAAGASYSAELAKILKSMGISVRP